MISFESEYKYFITVPPIGDIPLRDLDFEVATYVYPNRTVVFKKSDTDFVKPVDKDTYLVVIDKDNALKVGRGKVLAK